MTLKELQKAASDAQMDLRDYLLYLLVAGGGGSTNLQNILEAIETYGGFYNTYKTTSNNVAKDIPTYSDDANIGYLGGIYYNPNAYPVFLKFYEELTPTIGVSPIIYRIMVPALGQVLLDAATVYFYCFEVISFATTKFYTEADATAVVLDLEVFHKTVLQLP